MNKRLLSLLSIILIVILSGCSRGNDENNIILKMPGLESQNYTRTEFADYLKENEEAILEYLNSINTYFAFKENELYLKNKKVSILNIDIAKDKNFENTFYYLNPKANKDSDLVINVLLNEKDSSKSNITEKTVGDLKEENENFNKEYIKAGMQERNGKLY